KKKKGRKLQPYPDKEEKKKPEKAVKHCRQWRKRKSDRSGSAEENALRGASDVIFAAEGRWRGSVFSIRE
ncbi:hypothetical protein PDJAM_G00164300, partial [Pangasius djambal]|nr:hypothetical protein [Pangasius djambal]